MKKGRGGNASNAARYAGRLRLRVQLKNTATATATIKQ